MQSVAANKAHRTAGAIAGPVAPWLASARCSSPSRALHIVGRGLMGLPPSTWLLMDMSMLAGWLYLGYFLFPPVVLELTPHVAYWQAAVVFAFALIASSLVIGLYERATLASRSRLLTRMLVTTSVACLIAYGLIYVVMYSTIARRVTGFSLSTFFVSAILIRLTANYAMTEVHRGLLVVGSRALFDSFRAAKDAGFFSEYHLIGYANPSDGQSENVSRPLDDPQDLGSIHGVIPNLSRMGVSDIVVGAQGSRDHNVMDWVVPCLQHGCRVANESIFYEKATGQILVDQITPYWFLFSDLRIHCDEHGTLKRAIDLTAALFGLIVSAPLWPLIALAIKLDDRGPVLYSQHRVGQNGQVFRLYKFRTMRTDAENGKSVWASPDDPRVTRLGRFLRKSRLDELPQLYNILVGEMSVVGPRPERPDIVRELCEVLPYYAERHLVKPGLTGWAQIGYHYGATVEDAKRKLQFDLYYLKHMSFELDMMVIFRTIGTFLRGGW